MNGNADDVDSADDEDDGVMMMMRKMIKIKILMRTLDSLGKPRQV